MSDDKKEKFIHNVQKKLTLFFPRSASSFTGETVEEGLDSGAFVVKSAEILPYVQTALFDDKIIEVELNGSPQVYFSRIHDHIPDLVEVAENGKTRIEEPDYTAGDYLKLMSHIITLPLEPGLGNLHIRDSQQILLRLFTTNCAIELGTFFQNLALVRDIPVLRLAFPLIARQIQEARAFRAKVPDSLDFLLLVMGKHKRPNMRKRPLDISANGMSFQIRKEERTLFHLNETCGVQFILNDEMLVKVDGVVRHISKVRDKIGIEYRCGIQFDLPTRSVTASIEAIVATVQRAHLKELAEKSLDNGIRLIR
ncbi:MAG: PilZ domain-containing protein [Proteobacteria bacterium]|nr:PilZ domain-containing protein [Pseudomonadota bacterium]MBU1059198.1 PilZ domain-containing protein [Pseudomonadota bacterium]